MGSYRQLIYHIVFNTLKRKPTIAEKAEHDLFEYIGAIIRNKKGIIFCINGVSDHIHIMCYIHPTISVSNFVQDIKVSTSLWMKECGKFPEFEGWQEGFGVFSYSVWDKNMLINYIKEQKHHHIQEFSFAEFTRLLIQHEVKYDEKYLE